MFPDLDLDMEIPNIEAAIEELAKIGSADTAASTDADVDTDITTSSVAEVAVNKGRQYKIGDRIWVIDQDFPVPLLATVIEIYPETEVIYFKYDGRPNETYSSSDHSIQLLVPIEDRITPANFRNALKTLWQRFVIRTVKFVNKSGRGYIKYYDGRENDKVEYNSFEQAHKLVSPSERTNVVYHEYHYYGFTTTDTVYPNDSYKDIEFFFGSENTGQLTHDVPWSPFHIPMSLSNLEEDKASPLRGKLICGIPEKTAEGWQLGRWISCSRQFISLWSFVMGYSKESPRSLVDSATKLTKHHSKYHMLQDIFENLDTHLAATLCVDTSLINKVGKELKLAKQAVDKADCQHWVTKNCDVCGCHISDAANMYLKTMTTVYGVPKGYTLFADQPAPE